MILPVNMHPGGIQMEGLPQWLSTTILGLGTVFVGLIFLIFICGIMSAIVQRVQRAKTAAPAPAAAAAVEEPAPEPEPEIAEVEEIPDRGAFVAAVSAVIATVMGEDVSGLRIVSIQKVD